MTHTVSFSELNLNSSLLSAVEELGFTTPTEIQSHCIPLLQQGKDVLGLAQTGTGKTAAFALPLLAKVNVQENRPQLLVLAPTRELAVQVAEACESFARNIRGLRVLPIYGGQSFRNQLDGLRRGAHVVVGTPGRVIDHINRGTLMLNNIKAVVLDEADEMLRMGFIDDVETILSSTPDDKQMALFSATMPKGVQGICERYLKNAEKVEIAARNSSKASVEQHVWYCNNVFKNAALLRVLQAENYEGAIVFVRTKNDTVELAQWLEPQGIRVAPLNGDMNQAHREQTIARLKDGRIDVVIATDVAARGLDVERIGLVINYDLPFDSEAYVHRVGRTGRAGRSGKAISFVKHKERRLVRQIETDTGSTFKTMQLPSAEQVFVKRKVQLEADIAVKLESADITKYQELVEQMAADMSVDPALLAAALLLKSADSQPLWVEEFPEDPRGDRNERFSRDRNDRFSRDRGDRNDRFSRDRNDRGGRDAYNREDRGDRFSRDRNDRFARDDRAPREDRFARDDRAPREDRFARDDRAPREERRFGERTDAPRERRPRADMPKMDNYRIEVGKTHGVSPKHIVGAIANEADISSRFIGEIRLYDEHSTVQLPQGMPANLLQHMQRVFVCNRPLKMTLEQ